jgi:hypothetical protein
MNQSCEALLAAWPLNSPGRLAGAALRLALLFEVVTDYTRA